MSGVFIGGASFTKKLLQLFVGEPGGLVICLAAVQKFYGVENQPVILGEDVVAAVAAGKHRVAEEDFDFSYGLYTDGVKVASFAEGRIGYREWAHRSGRLEYRHSTFSYVRRILEKHSAILY